MPKKFTANLMAIVRSEYSKQVEIEAADEDEADEIATKLSLFANAHEIETEWTCDDVEVDDVDAWVETESSDSAEESFNITL